MVATEVASGFATSNEASPLSRQISACDWNLAVLQSRARNLLSAWVETGFVVVADPAKKTRKYALRADYVTLLKLG